MESKPLRILGIDPGTRVVGWGIVEIHGSRLVLRAYGAIAPPPTLAVEVRLGMIAAALRAIAAEHQPDEVALEEVFHARNAQSAIRLGEGRGAAIAAVAPLPVFTYAANLVKKAVTGKGGRSKESVARMVGLLLGLAGPPQPTDASDGIALAICHAQRRQSTAFLAAVRASQGG